MCGIVGKVYRDPQRNVDEGLIAQMKRCIVHRGPDDHGTYLRAPAGLGFQRLSIIDLATGHQPMLNEDDSVAVVFNGEIYNFQALREELLAHGHVFRTHSDTETILHGFEQWGHGMPDRLRGMFAFAVFDHKTNALFLARDRTGKKPLYYTVIREGTPDEALLFASEMKALLADPQVERNLDLTALNHFLSYQYVPQPWSIFKGIHKLPPAHWLMYKDGRVTVERYWHLDYEPKRQLSLAAAAEETLARLDEAVKVRLISEVPLGCFLSGGIDSSMIVAMMRRHISGDLRTFSIGFEDEKFNELPYARQVVDQFSTRHEEFVVEPDALECLGTMAWHFDEPFADSSALPTYYLSRMTRKHVTVALNGDGGDESFAGYARYKGIEHLRKYMQVPRLLRQALGPGLELAAKAVPQVPRTGMLAYANRMSLWNDDRRYVQYMLYFPNHFKDRLISSAMKAAIPSQQWDSEQITLQWMAAMNGAPAVDRYMSSDIAYYLPGALLPKVDRMTMANSLEGRSPFLDHPLMEFAARLPAELKFQDRNLKHVLKTAASGIFSQEFLNRPKMGFGVPLSSWFRGKLRPLLEGMLLDETARKRGLFNQDYVKLLIQQHVEGTLDHHNRLWALLMFEAWARTFLDRADPISGPVNFNP